MKKKCIYCKNFFREHAAGSIGKCLKHGIPVLDSLCGCEVHAEGRKEENEKG